MFGFTYKGKHSYNDFGIIIGKFNVPVIGDLKEYRQDIPGIQGTVMLQNTDLQDRIVELTECFIQFDSNFDTGDIFTALQRRMREIAAWLNPRNSPDYFTFDDDTEVSYLGIVQDKINTTMSGIARSFTIKLRCDPFLYSSQPAATSWNNVSINSSGSFSLYNDGTEDVSPVITITPVTSGATFSNITITNTTTNVSLSWSGSASTSLVIDNQNMVAYTTSGSSQINQFLSLSGSFLSLPPQSKTNFNLTVTGNIQLSFSYRYKYY